MSVLDYASKCFNCKWRSEQSNGVTEGHAHGSQPAPVNPPKGSRTYYCHLNPPNGYYDKYTMVHEHYYCSHWKEYGGDDDDEEAD